MKFYARHSKILTINNCLYYKDLQKDFVFGNFGYNINFYPLEGKNNSL